MGGSTHSLAPGWVSRPTRQDARPTDDQVMGTSIAVTAGAVASIVFASSVLPMLRKAARTKDLTSYSRSQLVLANIGNLVYSLYVFHLPAGPIWLLHTFYAVSTALMLFWSVRYGRPSARAASPAVGQH